MGPETCRTCFSKIVQNGFSLLDQSTGRMLESLISIKIEPAAEVSTVICIKCYLNLKLAYRIQQNMIKAEETLKTKFRPSEVIPIAEIEAIEPKDEPPETLITDTYCIICGLIPRGNNHYRFHFKRGQYCSICKCQFETFENYKHHLLMCQDELSYQCTECQASFRYRSIHDLHVEKLHALPKTVSEQVQEHVQDSEVDAPAANAEEKMPKPKVKCGECGKEFKSKKSLHSHKTRKCPICQKDVLFNRLHAHLKDHEGPQVCEICGARMKNVGCLRQHIFYMHSKARYKCEECGKEFKKKVLLTLHARRHNDQRSFTCETCGKSFYQNEFLQRHIRMTHLKLRPFICKFCQKGFSSRHAMRTHERQHTNETPYRCEVCGEPFRQNVSLKSHKKSKHGIKESEDVKCEVCGKGFASQQALIGHARLHK